VDIFTAYVRQTMLTKTVVLFFFSFLYFAHQMYSLVCQGNYYRTMVLMCLINYMVYGELGLFPLSITSVNTEMCCPKGKCGCQYFILLT
jgi:hypothetical protein